MILLTDEQQQIVFDALTVAAVKRLRKLGIELYPPAQVPLTPDAVLGVAHGAILVDAKGFLWLAATDVFGEVSLCPFDQRQAFIIIKDDERPEGYRTWASRDGSDGGEAVIPVLPLRYVGREETQS